MNNKVYIGFLLMAFSLLSLSVQAHGDEVHEKTTMPERGVFTLYAESKLYELTLKHDLIEAGHASSLTLYLADFNTNAPLENADLQIAVQDHPDVALSTDMHEPGIYHINGIFPKNGAYDLLVQVSVAGEHPDNFLLKGVEVGKLPPAADVASEEAAHQHDSIAWWIFAVIFAAGLGLGYLIFNRYPKAAAAVLVIVMIPAGFQMANAHGDDDHGNEGAGVSSGTEVFIPKETQFLFGIRTLSLGIGDFQPSIEFYGTIIPSHTGKINVSTPVAGKLVKLNVKPGQRVSEGQILAVLRPSLSSVDQVSVAAETGRLQTELSVAREELRAAEREKDRLAAIQDIAAGKDVQAAEARYLTAKAAVASLEQSVKSSSGSAAADFVLRAPVQGTIGSFTWAAGTEVPAASTLFSVTNLQKVYVEAQVYDRDAHLVNQAERYTVTCTNHDHKTAEIVMISEATEVNPSNQSQRVLFELMNPEEEFKIGEFVTLQAFHQKSKKTIFIPNSAMSEMNGKPVVFIKEGPEAYRVQIVSVGDDNGTHAEISKGLTPGQRFVTDGTYPVKMMMQNQ